MCKRSLDSKSNLNGVLYGSISVFISMLAAAITFPFLQAQRDQLQCDTLCYGNMQSARSALTLVGSVLVGRLSDRIGRKLALYIGLCASILSNVINMSGQSITTMWMSIIPSSLLNQNFSVLKALMSDYSSETGQTESEKASDIGRLGMAVGIAFMVGPAVGATLLKDYNQACLIGLGLLLLSGLFLYSLPEPEKIKKKREKKRSLLSFLSLPAAQTPGARLLFFMRGSMAIAFNVFMTVWTVSLKQRFNFGPKDHAFFMGWIGLCYAVSQGVLAKILIKTAGEDPTKVLLVCIVGLSIGRVLAMLTSSLILVYIIMAFVIVALGVVNTAMSSACSHLADSGQVGGLLGVMEAVESLGGLVGPTLGGILFKIGPNVPLITVVIIYGAVFIAVKLYFQVTIVFTKPIQSKESLADLLIEQEKNNQTDIHGDNSDKNKTDLDKKNM